MVSFQDLNPFSKRESHTHRSVTTYKVLSTLTWLLSIVTSFYYSFHRPHDDLKHHTLWEVNAGNPSGFTLNATIVSIFWVVLFVLQLGYISALFSANEAHVNAAASVGSHFIFNNLLHFAWIMLLVRHHFILSLLILIVNFFNLSSLYFRHNSYARWIHTPAVSAPLAWTFVAIYWNGAIAVYHPNNLIARIFANVFIWGILAYGAFFIFAFKDYTIGFSLSVLAAAIGVAQLVQQIIALQAIFAFVISGLLFILTLVVAIPAWRGQEFSWRRSSEQPADAERAPLLSDN